MNTKIICPVCDRSAIEINICPNCQTDLSLIRMLSDLPQLDSIKSNFQWLKWSLGILVTSLLFSWGLWVF
jgi:C4-type Zn-finger protein